MRLDDFWMIDGVPSAVAAWVQGEVVEAFTHYWTTDPPMIYMPETPLLQSGVATVVCCSYELPGPDGQDVTHQVEVNLLDELKEFASAYGDLTARGQGLSDEQVADALLRASRLRDLAAQIVRLADEAEAIAKTA